MYVAQFVSSSATLTHKRIVFLLFPIFVVKFVFMIYFEQAEKETCMLLNLSSHWLHRHALFPTSVFCQIRIYDV